MMERRQLSGLTAKGCSGVDCCNERTTRLKIFLLEDLPVSHRLHAAPALHLVRGILLVPSCPQAQMQSQLAINTGPKQLLNIFWSSDCDLPTHPVPAQGRTEPSKKQLWIFYQIMFPKRHKKAPPQIDF